MVVTFFLQKQNFCITQTNSALIMCLGAAPIEVPFSTGIIFNFCNTNDINTCTTYKYSTHAHT